MELGFYLTDRNRLRNTKRCHLVDDVNVTASVEQHFRRCEMIVVDGTVQRRVAFLHTIHATCQCAYINTPESIDKVK